MIFLIIESSAALPFCRFVTPPPNPPQLLSISAKEISLTHLDTSQLRMSSASPKDICFFVSVVCSLACVIIFSAHAHAQETEARSAQKLLLLLLDGARHDYLDHSDTPLPGFKQVTARGVQADYLIPDFPTVSYPNYYSLMTGG